MGNTIDGRRDEEDRAERSTPRSGGAHAIVVEHEYSLPTYVRADPSGHCHTSSSLTNPPPEHFQYSSSELPTAMKVLKRDYPEAFIVAHEVNFIDHEKMSDWCLEKGLSSCQPRSVVQQLGLDGVSSKPAGKRK